MTAPGYPIGVQPLLSLNEREAAAQGVNEFRFTIDWKKLGPWLCQKACGVVGTDPKSSSFDGVIIYASYNPRTDEGRTFHGWAKNWLDRQAGISVVCLERKPRALPKCPICHRQIEFCPYYAVQNLGDSPEETA